MTFGNPSFLCWNRVFQLAEHFRMHSIPYKAGGSHITALDKHWFPDTKTGTQRAQSTWPRSPSTTQSQNWSYPIMGLFLQVPNKTNWRPVCSVWGVIDCTDKGFGARIWLRVAPTNRSPLLSKRLWVSFTCLLPPPPWLNLHLFFWAWYSWWS